MKLTPLAVPVVALAMLAPGAMAGRAQTGLHGYVTKGPITPICYENRPCEGPAAGVTLTFTSADGTKVRTQTRASGFYRVVLPAGRYSVKTSARSPNPVPVPARVRVRAGSDVRVDFFIDTGIQ